jgi:hypothetical protein
MLHDWIADVEASVLEVEPIYAEYVVERRPSPWVGEGPDRWWPVVADAT